MQTSESVTRFGVEDHVGYMGLECLVIGVEKHPGRELLQLLILNQEGAIQVPGVDSREVSLFKKALPTLRVVE